MLSVCDNILQNTGTLLRAGVNVVPKYPLILAELLSQFPLRALTPASLVELQTFTRRDVSVNVRLRCSTHGSAIDHSVRLSVRLLPGNR